MKQIVPLESSREIKLARKILSNSEIVGVGMFYEASRYGCRKTIFDVTKVIYNTYSCAISSMSREMMKMDDRDSAECQNWEYRDKMVILEVVKSLNDKSATVVFFFKLKRNQKRGGERGKPVAISFERFLERENTSL